MVNIPIIFRAVKSGQFKGEVTAFFPTFNRGEINLICYSHVGQHGEASREYYYSCRPAKPAEFKELLAELQAIYSPDNLVISKRIR